MSSPLTTACMPVANALSVVCSTNQDSFALICEDGLYVSQGKCLRMCYLVILGHLVSIYALL